MNYSCWIKLNTRIKITDLEAKKAELFHKQLKFMTAYFFKPMASYNSMNSETF